MEYSKSNPFLTLSKACIVQLQNVWMKLEHTLYPLETPSTNPEICTSRSYIHITQHPPSLNPAFPLEELAFPPPAAKTAVRLMSSHTSDVNSWVRDEHLVGALVGWERGGEREDRREARVGKWEIGGGGEEGV